MIPSVRAGALVAALVALAAPALAQTVVVTSSRGANLREKPDRAAAVVARVASGAELELLDRSGEWYEVVAPASGEPAWIHASVARVVGEGSAPPPATAVDPDVADEPETAPPASDPTTPAASARRARFWSRFTAVVGGTLATAGSDFEGRRRFTEFAEEGHLDADYARAAGPGFELGVEYRLGRRLGAAASLNLVSRDASTTYEAAIPHPLYLGQARRATGAVDGLSYAERAFHFDLVYRLDRGRWRYGVFAGPSHVHVSSELIERVQYQQAYPFDEVQVTSVPRGTFSGSALGFNAGAELDYRWRAGLGAVLMVRYHRASVDLPQAADDVVAVKAGGLQIGAALRVFFR